MTDATKPFYLKFPTNESCILYLENVRWGSIPKCPRCGFSSFSQIRNKSAYHCNYCNRTFTVTMQTVFHKSKIDLQKWFYAICATVHPTDKITARDLAEKLEIAKDTAWAIQKKIKTGLVSSPNLLLIIDKNLNELYVNK